MIQNFLEQQIVLVALNCCRKILTHYALGQRLVEKCKVIYYGYNPLIEYQMYDAPLASSTEEKDLGVSIKRNLKSESQISSCLVKTNKIY